MTRIRIAIVDDHPIVTEGLALSLGEQADLDVVWTAATLHSARDKLIGGKVVDVVLTEVRLPDGSGLDLLPGPGGTGPRFLVLTDWDRSHDVKAARERGASGYLVKDSSLDAIIAAIRSAALGASTFDARTRPRETELTDREALVVRLVAEGRSNAEIAAALSISKKTVEACLTRLFERMEFTTRTELALWAERAGWLDVAPDLPIGT